MERYNWIEMTGYMHEIRLFSSLHIRRAKKGGPSSAQELDLLSRVGVSDEPVTPRKLQKEMGISKPMISRLIEQLEKKGLLQKKQSSGDRRSYFLHVTKEGERELKHTYAYYLEPVYQLRRALGEEEFGCMMALIRKANQCTGAEQEQ